VINGFVGNGIHLSGTSANQNQIFGNFIGTNAAGTIAVPNGDTNAFASAGVYVDTASANTIGGSTAAERNIISGNLQDGVGLIGTYNGGVLPNDYADSNVIIGNYIGTDVSGTNAIANAEGVDLHGIVSNTTVGGTSASARNLISGNSG